MYIKQKNRHSDMDGRTSKTTKYIDGSPIPYAIRSHLLVASFYWLNNDSLSYKNVYGALYNWHAVNTSKLAPSGWHIPKYSELNTLIDFLGGDVAGGKLKETGTNSLADS